MERAMHIIAGIFTIAVVLAMFINIGVFIFVDKIELFATDSPLAYTALVAVVLLILVGINVVREIKFLMPKDTSGIKKFNKQDLSDLRLLGIFTLGIFVYILLLRYLHFLAGSIIFMILGMLLLNDVKEKVGIKILKAGLAAVITVPALYATFQLAFDVMLP